MDPHTGDVYRLRSELVTGETGDLVDMQQLRQRLAEIVDASEDEMMAVQSDRLVSVSEQVARKLQLGQRERDRRKRRNTAAKQARRRNRS